MEESDEILKLIDEINIRKSNSRDYKKMKAEEISREFKDIIKFEQESFKKIEEFEKTQKNLDLIQYAKMICKNTIDREIAHIQEIYLKKIDEEFLSSK
ncbi:MAG: hypothetical protein OEQ15_04160 [Nitrosopumilus sp.]|nr:hypothetical protein [Nitrosopumilus sp.]MDH3793740.1 hypothetical protein [Nitrosopumilus sp.]MDH3855081.1 hypothetical protein [Nitrosopumilus sp.]